MAILNNNPLIGASGQSRGYQIQRSLRFNSADSAYLNRTPASASNRKTWTWSAWVKRSSLPGTSQALFGTGTAGSNNNSCQVRFNGNDKLEVFDYVSGYNFNYVTTQVFRDVSAWYHIVAVLDTTQATSSNRVKVYINGTQITAFDSSTAPSLNFDGLINSTVAHGIGRGGEYNDFYFNGYMTEVNFIDGQALTPSSFGQTNGNTGVWEPKAYSGSYGTNGFYLKFADNSGTTSTTLGKDSSGNGNNWTPNNFSVTAGAGNDSLVDTPTPYGTDTGAGGEVRGNYATLNPLNLNGTITSNNGNLDTGTSSEAAGRITGTLGVSSGKWYFEATRTDANGIGNLVAVGVMSATAALGTGQYGGNPTSSGANANEWVLTDRGVACNNTTYTNLNSTLGNIDQNEVVQVCIDMDAKKIWFGINNTFSGSPSAGTGEAFSNLPSTVVPLGYKYNGTFSFNFGQRPFASSSPSGFKALVTTNLP